MPGVLGAWKSNLKVYEPPGATVPLTPSRRLSAIHEPSANLLARSRGCVVPTRVLESQPLVPPFLRTSDSVSVCPANMVMAVDA